jgi:hypothetical protein
MSRGYAGAYRVLVIHNGGTEYSFTDPAAYEDCERACLLFGWGLLFEGRRVERALIVPVAGVHPELPGTDFEVRRQ